MTVSPNRSVRNSLGRKKLKKNALCRQLRMESLERRELMAADIAPFHNYLLPHDVDGDYQTSPLDVLMVINQLNAGGTGSLSDRTPPSTRSGLIDTDGDNNLSPLDALTIINSLNGGEGEVIKGAVKYQFYALNADGTVGRNLDPNPNDSVSEAIVNKGEKFVVRTLMADFRNNPFGVFSAYHDFSYTNADGSTDERMQLQWSDYNALKIGMPDLDPSPSSASIAILTGSFKLQYGTETTDTIDIATRIPGVGRPPVTDVTQTAKNIQAAIEKLPSIGTGNVTVRVNSIDPDLGYNFDIFFRNAKARTDIPNPSFVETNFTVSTGGPPTPTISGITNPSPSNSDAARGALNYQFADQFPLYVNGPNGFLEDLAGTPGGRRLNLLGAFSNSSSTIPQPQAFNFFNVVDTAYVGASAGIVNLTGRVSPLPIGASGNNLGMALYNDGNAYLTESQVSFENAVVRIVDRLSAVNDTYPLDEDAASTSLNVTSNDSEQNGLSFGIVAVTQPTNGAGTVSFVPGGAAQSVQFLAASNFNGPTTFKYTIRSSRGDESEATVTVNIAPINDPPIILATQFNATEDQTTPLVIAPTTIFSPGPTADEAGQILTLAILAGPTAAQGTALINTATGNLEFRPAQNFFGTVNITVRGTDSGPNSPAPNANTTNATLTITVASVNDAPTIVGTTFSIAEDATTPLTISAPQLFLPGPSNESSQVVTLAIVNGPTTAQGTLTVASNGLSLQFLPASNFFGPVVVRVSGTDNGSPALTTESLITISVTPVNDPPDAVDDTSGARFVAIGLTGTPTLLDVMRNDSPGPGESSIDTIRIKPFTTSTTTLGGTVAVNNDRTRVVYTPPVNAVNVVDSFTYTIEDSAGLTDSARVEVFVFPPVLPYAIDDSVEIAETPNQQAFPFDVLQNDLINDGATPRLVSIVTQPDSGKGTAAVTGIGNASDRVEYTAPAHFFGTAVVKYRMTDSVEESAPVDAFLTVRVTEVNDPPVASELRDSGLEDTVKTISGSSITNGLSRGPFEDFQTLTVTKAILKSGPGTLVLSAGNLTYTPADDFFGQVVIEYTVTDNGTTKGVADPKSATGTLILTIDPVNDKPIPSPKSFTTAEDTAKPIDVSAIIAGDLPGPSNESNQTVTLVNLTGPITTQRGGTVTQNGNQLVYTPADNFNGVDTFTYQITDGQTENQFATGTVTINVTEVNDAPIATNIRKTVFAGVNSVIDVTAELAAMSRGAANEASQTLLISRLLSSPNVGTIQSFTGTTVTYFAPLGTDGTTSFVFEVIDNGTTNGRLDAKTSSATFTIEILPFIPSSLKGIVFIDDNANGVLDRNPTTREPLELPIGGVEVTISYPDPANPGRSIQTTEMTEADGSYDFELLPPGTYTISYSTPLLMTDSPTTVKSYTRTIVAPGDVNSLFDFPVLGMIPEYGSQLEYLASSFYNRDGSLRSRGLYASVNADGVTDWTSRKDGYEQDRFHELVLSGDGKRAYLTAVRGDGQLYTATLVENRQFIRLQLANGSQLVRVLASSSDLTWVAVNPATPPITARGYLETVDDFYRQEGWNWNG